MSDVITMRPGETPENIRARSSALLSHRAFLFEMKFEAEHRPDDLNQAIRLYRQALEQLPTSDPLKSKSITLTGLANVLSRDNSSPNSEALDEAIHLYQEALELQPPSHPIRSFSLSGLADAVWNRFKERDTPEDLDYAILLHKEAMKLRPRPNIDRPHTLHNLAIVLHERCVLKHLPEDLDAAIELAREALELQPPPDPKRWLSMNSLAQTLHRRSVERGQPGDLDEAIELYHGALDLGPPLHNLRLQTLGDLVNALKHRFQQRGQTSDLDDAILLSWEAVGLGLPSSPEISSSLYMLANALQLRYLQRGEQKDLDDAISRYREVVKLRPAPHPSRSSSLSSLAYTLNIQFRRSGQQEDLDEAILLDREAVQLNPSADPQRGISLISLANVLLTRFESRGAPEDLDEAILLHYDGLELHPSRPSSLNSLAHILHTRFELTGQVEDLDAAEAASSKSLYLLPQRHPDTGISQFVLGRVLVSKYLQTGEREYLDKAMAAFQAASQCDAAPALLRISCTHNWAAYAEYFAQPSLEAYKLAFELLPRLALLGMDLWSRYDVLKSTGLITSLACDATACAIRSDDFETAVELLEAGRTVFWSQVLQVRTPLDELKAVSPTLAEKLRDISQALDQRSLQDDSRNLLGTPMERLTMEQESDYHRHLSDQWHATVQAVRQLDGFQDFLRPKTFATLRKAATNGPVVILNSSRSGCAALILTLSGVKHITLSNFTWTSANALVERLRYMTALTIRRSHGPRLQGPSPRLSEASLYPVLPRTPVLSASDTSGAPARHGKVWNLANPEDEFQCVLSTLWEAVAKPVISALDLKKSKDPPRMWWCPTGLFSFLPIHASGIYHSNGEDECVSDYVVSSYTPNLTKLLHPQVTETDPFKLLVVIQPETPGYTPLPNVRDELREIERQVPSHYLDILGLENMPSSVENVRARLPTVSFVHFACHGIQDRNNPLDSAMLLEDGQLTVSQMIERPQHASLAFLSACETAMGNENLPDEVIHFAATMLFAGFRGAVATLWSIRDDDGPKITKAFYEHFFKADDIDGATESLKLTPNHTEAARALQLAVAKLRTEGCSFKRWVPFVHFGL